MNACTIRRVVRFAPLAAVAAVIVPVAAFAAAESIQATSASLLAKGAAVELTISYTCQPGDTIGNYGMAGVFVTVQQAVSKSEQAIGSTMVEPSAACSGSAQPLTVTVPANVPGPPFRTGPALASVSLSGSNASGFFSASSTNAIKVSK